MRYNWKIIILSIILVAFQGPGTRGQVIHSNKNHPVSLVDELRPLYEISGLPQYRDHTMMAQISSYDTTGGNDDGFNGKYSYLRRNTDSSLVIFDVEGSGVINRIATPTPTEDTLDFYIDDSSRAALSIKYTDLFSGKVFPFVQPLCGNRLGGYFCYFPILFQKRCRIVCRGKKMQFHQVQYRLYPTGTIVKSFSTSLTKEEKEFLDRVAFLWNKETKNIADFTPDPKEVRMAATAFEIKPGETKKIFNLDGGGRIIGIEFDGDKMHQWINRDMDIKITWDNEKNPAVYCPLADFFGYAFGRPSMRSLVLGSLDNINYCYLPMPFDKNAAIHLICRKTNVSNGSTPVKVKIYYTNNKRDKEREGKFYTSWKSNKLFKGTGPHVFLDTRGKGHYVGTILLARGLNPGMTYFFEGDDSTAIDGISRIHGTGSEDYFNGGWYALPDRWDAKMSLPIHGALDYSLPFCRTGGYRFYLSDKISFEKSIFQSIEHGPVQNSIPVDYTSLALYYSNAPVSEFIKPSNELAKLYFPDTLIIYPQLMDFNISGDIATSSLWAYDTGGESFIFSINDESAIRIAMDKIPYGKYQLFGDFVKLPEGCEFALWQGQNQLSGWISTNKPGKERVEQFYLSDIVLNDFKTTLTFKFKTTLTNKSFFLNRLILVKEKPGNK